MYKWDKLKAPNLFGQRCDKMSTRYDYLAGEILKSANMKDQIPDIVALAKVQGMDVLAMDEYVGTKSRPCFTFYSPCTNFGLYGNHINQSSNFPYHLLLATPSAAERREWIAYCSVLAYMHQRNLISDDFMSYAHCGDNALRNDTFHRIAVSVLIPEVQLAKWHPKGRPLATKRYNNWSNRDKEDAAAFFGVPLAVMDERLNLYEGGGILLTPNFVKGDNNG